MVPPSVAAVAARPQAPGGRPASVAGRRRATATPATVSGGDRGERRGGVRDREHGRRRQQDDRGVQHAPSRGGSSTVPPVQVSVSRPASAPAGPSSAAPARATSATVPSTSARPARELREPRRAAEVAAAQPPLQRSVSGSASDQRALDDAGAERSAASGAAQQRDREDGDDERERLRRAAPAARRARGSVAVLGCAVAARRRASASRPVRAPRCARDAAPTPRARPRPRACPAARGRAAPRRSGARAPGELGGLMPPPPARRGSAARRRAAAARGSPRRSRPR